MPFVKQMYKYVVTVNKITAITLKYHFSQALIRTQSHLR